MNTPIITKRELAALLHTCVEDLQDLEAKAHLGSETAARGYYTETEMTKLVSLLPRNGKLHTLWN